MAGQRLASSGTASPRSASHPVTVSGVGTPGTQRNAVRSAGRASGSVARGVGAFLKPFGRVGGSVFLEVVGVFFLLFVLVFGQMAWRARLSYAHGPDHSRFLAAAVITAVFLYLSVSSFWRARKR